MSSRRRRGLVALGVMAALACVAAISIFETRKARKLAAFRLDPPVAVARTTGAADAPCRLLIIGDSRVAEWPLSPPDAWRIDSWGFPGATAEAIAAATRELPATTRPTVLVVAAGVNDTSAAVLEGRAGDAVTRASMAIGQMIARGYDAGARRVVATTVVPPERESLAERIVYRGQREDAARRLSDRIRQLGAARGFAILDAERLFLDAPAAARAAYRRDSLHWNPAFYTRLDAALWRAIGPGACKPA